MSIQFKKMNILVTPDHSLLEIQEEFQKYFPFLKIEFFKQKSQGEEYSAKDLLDHLKRVKDISAIREPVNLEFDALMAVSELENLCNESLGIHLEVFRKSGKVWLKTSATDHWTLEEQNKEARESEVNTLNKPDGPDYHEQE